MKLNKKLFPFVFKTTLALTCVAMIATHLGCSSGGEKTADESDESDDGTEESTEEGTPTDPASESESDGASSDPASEKSGKKKPPQTAGTTGSSPYAGATAVALPQEAPTQGGVTLNGFYFVRESDTSWEGLAQKFFGDESKSKELKTWNSAKRLSPGTLVFYPSPQRSGDPSLKSFQEDRGELPTSYEVKKGESLSTIAKNLLGHPRSWKELSAWNPNLKAPDQLTPGTSLQIPATSVATPLSGIQTTSSNQSFPESTHGTPTSSIPENSRSTSNSADSAPTTSTENSREPASADSSLEAENSETASAPKGLVGRAKVFMSSRNGQFAAGGVALVLLGSGVFLRIRSRRLAGI